MTERDPSPSEILADMLSEAGPDQEGEWRVSIPTRRPPTLAEAVVVARQGLDAAAIANPGSREAGALSQLLTAALVRHENRRCDCGLHHGVDPICVHAQELATAIAGF